MLAVPVDCLAPDIPVVVHVLDNVGHKSAVLLKLEVLHPSPWVAHADDVGHLPLVVDIQAVLAFGYRFVATRVIDLNIGVVVLHCLVMLGLLISVPCRGIELRIVELPLGTGKHFVVLPEFGNKLHLIKVDVSGEESIRCVDRELRADLSFWYVPLWGVFSEGRFELRFNLVCAARSTT